MVSAKKNWLLVDYENVQDVDFKVLEGASVEVVLFAGEKQKFSLEFTNSLAKFIQSKGLYSTVESAGNGKNALDFQIAFYAGRILEREPEAILHFITKDTGFDPLIKHIKAQKRSAHRASSFSTLAFLTPRPVQPTPKPAVEISQTKVQVQAPAKKANYLEMPAPERLQYALGRLSRQVVLKRPRKRKTLLSHLASLFGNQLNTAIIEQILKALVTNKKVVIDEKENVTYAF